MKHSLMRRTSNWFITSTTLLLIAIALGGCEKEPSIGPLVVNPPKVEPGGKVSVSISSIDNPPKGRLRYVWNAKGKVPNEDQSGGEYVAPNEPGPDTIICEVWADSKFLVQRQATVQVIPSGIGTLQPRAGGIDPGLVSPPQDKPWDNVEQNSWHPGGSEYAPDKLRAKSVTLSTDFHTEGTRSGRFDFGPATGTNVSAAFVRWTAQRLEGYSELVFDAANPTPSTVTFRLGVSSRAGGWCEYEGNVPCPADGRAEIRFNLENPMVNSAIRTGIARIVLILDPGPEAGSVYIDNIRLVTPSPTRQP